MRYTEPTILNVSKAASLIMGQGTKNADKSEGNPHTAPFTDDAAYEADE